MVESKETKRFVGTAIHRRIVSEVQASGVFSVLADETTDVAHKPQLAVSVRYVGTADVSGKSMTIIRERFPEFINSAILTGDALSRVIVGVLNRAGVDGRRLGQGRRADR